MSRSSRCQFAPCAASCRRSDVACAQRLAEHADRTLERSSAASRMAASRSSLSQTFCRKPEAPTANALITASSAVDAVKTRMCVFGTVSRISPARLNTVLVWHDQVHQHHIRLNHLGQLDCLLAVCRFTDDFVLLSAVQDFLQPLTDNGVVVDQHDAYRCGLFRWLLRLGGRLARRCCMRHRCLLQIRQGIWHRTLLMRRSGPSADPWEDLSLNVPGAIGSVDKPPQSSG